MIMVTDSMGYFLKRSLIHTHRRLQVCTLPNKQKKLPDQFYTYFVTASRALRGHSKAFPPGFALRKSLGAALPALGKPRLPPLLLRLSQPMWTYNLYEMKF